MDKKNFKWLLIAITLLIVVSGCTASKDSSGGKATAITTDEGGPYKPVYATLNITVLNQKDSTPIPNAYVKLTQNDFLIKDGKTSTAGTLQLSGIEQTGYFKLTATKDGYQEIPSLPNKYFQITYGSTLSKTIKMDKGAGLEFGVSDSNTINPIPDVNGTLSIQNPDSTFTPIMSVLSNSYGNGSFGFQKEGTYKITATHPTYQTFETQFTHPNPAFPPYTSTIAFNMQPLPVPICGNDVCELGENSTSCPHDCVPPPTCGNGIIEAPEQCDGTNLGGKTCTTQGFSGGTLTCSSNCTFNTSQCTTTDTNTFNLITLKNGKGYPYDPNNTTGQFDWKTLFKYSNDGNNLTGITIANDGKRWTNSSGSSSYNPPLYVPSQAVTANNILGGEPSGIFGEDTALFLDIGSRPPYPGSLFFHYKYLGFNTNVQSTGISFLTNFFQFFDQNATDMNFDGHIFGGSAHTIPYYIQLSKTGNSSFTFDGRTIYYKSTYFDTNVSDGNVSFSLAPNTDTIYTPKQVRIQFEDTGPYSEIFYEGDYITGLQGKNSLAGKTVSVRVDSITLAGPSPGVPNAKFTLFAQNGSVVDVITVANGESLRYNFVGSDGLEAIQNALIVTSIKFSQKSVPFTDGQIAAPIFSIPGKNSKNVKYILFADNGGASGDLYLLIYKQTFDGKFDADVKFFGTDTLENGTINRPYYWPDQTDFGGGINVDQFYIAKFGVETGGDYLNGAEANADFDTTAYVNTRTGKLPTFPNTNLSYYTAPVEYNQNFVDGSVRFKMDADPSTINQPKLAYNDYGSIFGLESNLIIIVPDQAKRNRVLIGTPQTTTTTTGGEVLTIPEGDTLTASDGTRVNVQDIRFTANCNDGFPNVKNLYATMAINNEIIDIAESHTYFTPLSAIRVKIQDITFNATCNGAMAIVTNLTAIVVVGGIDSYSNAKVFSTGETSGTTDFNSDTSAPPEISAVLTDSSLPNLKNIQATIKINGTNYVRTFKEEVGAKFDMLFDSQGNRGAADLEGTIANSGDMNYTVNLGSGIPANFTDKPNDLIRIPFFGSFWAVRYTNSAAGEIQIYRNERTETLAGGQILAGLRGNNSLYCQNVSIKLDWVTSGGPNGPYYAKFTLANQLGNPVNEYTSEVGENLKEHFFGSDGLEALSDHVFVSSIFSNGVELIVVPEHACS